MTSGLLTDEVLAWIGRAFTFGPEPVVERDVKRYLAATQAWQRPEDVPEDAAPRVPPMFYRTLGRWVGPVSAAGPDGLWGDLRPTVGTGQTLAGGIEVRFARDLVIGDVVTVRRRLDSLEEKVGRRRTFVLARWSTDLVDADNAEVLREVVTEMWY